MTTSPLSIRTTCGGCRQGWNLPVELAILAILCASCEPFPPGGPSPEENLYGQLGTVGIQTDTTWYHAENVRAAKVSSLNDAVVDAELSGGKEPLFFRFEFRALEGSVWTETFVVRIGKVDSTARFYQPQKGEPFNIDVRQEGPVVYGIFGGWLVGTGTQAWGTKLLILRGTIRVPLS